MSLCESAASRNNYLSQPTYIPAWCTGKGQQSRGLRRVLDSSSRFASRGPIEIKSSRGLMRNPTVICWVVFLLGSATFADCTSGFLNPNYLNTNTNTNTNIGTCAMFWWMESNYIIVTGTLWINLRMNVPPADSYHPPQLKLLPWLCYAM